MERFSPIKSPSLKELFVREIENLIIAGELSTGERLPPERDLAASMKVSRGVVNAGIAELTAKGFLDVVPRQGTFVADYKRKGSMGILTSIMTYHGGKLDRQIFESLMAVRQLIEVESARLAAVRRSDGELEKLEEIMRDIDDSGDRTAEFLAERNFLFHYNITLASGNILYSLLMGAFEPLCLELIRRYFTLEDCQSSLLNHRLLLEWIRKREPEKSAAAMRTILEDGARILCRLTE